MLNHVIGITTKKHRIPKRLDLQVFGPPDLPDPTDSERQYAKKIDKYAKALNLSPEVYTAFAELGHEAKKLDGTHELFTTYNANEMVDDLLKLQTEPHYISQTDVDAFATEALKHNPNARRVQLDPTASASPTEIWLDIHHTAMANPEYDGGTTVTPEMLRIDAVKLRDLRHLSPEMKDRAVKAVAQEMNQLILLKTFEITEQTKETTPVSTKIVFKVKVNSKGEHVKDKARLVAKGYQEMLGQDFVCTFSPMTTTTALRLLLAYAVDLGIQVYQSDIPHAFIRATLDKKIRIALPPGISFENERGSTDDNFCVDIMKALYGLKQAPQLFHRLLSTFFTKHGYQRCKVDTCIF